MQDGLAPFVPQICTAEALSRPNDSNFYEFLRQSIDHDVPDFDKTGAKIR